MGEPMIHNISSVTERHSSGGGNMESLVPVCSCGWRGFSVAAYNDDQYSQVQRQMRQHLIEVGAVGVMR